MHDGTRYVPPSKSASSTSAQPTTLPGLKGVELPQKGRLYIDQVGPEEFQLTDLVTQEIQDMPPGTWHLQQWDDLEEVALLGCHQGSCEEVELDPGDFLKTKAYQETCSGHMAYELH